MKYLVVRYSSLVKTVIDVEKLLGEGWETVGGLSTVVYGDNIYYMQALKHN